MHDVADFLRGQAAFAAAGEGEVDELARHVEIEFFPAGAVIFGQGDRRMRHVRIIRRGSVELGDHGQVLDLLCEGDLLGHATMLSGLPTSLEARAAEDTLVYRVEADAIRPLLTRPEALPFVARSLLARPSPRDRATVEPADPSGMSVAHLAREPAVLCPRDLPIRDAAQRMVERGVSSVLVRDEAGQLGIVTDRDLRERVIAGGIPVDAPIAGIASFPAITMPAERTGADALLLMLTHGFRHVPVTTSRGELAGIVRDIDLLAAQTSTPFILRRSIATAPDLEALRAAASRLRPTIVALCDANVPHPRVSAVISIVADAVTQRLIELGLETQAQPPGAFAWLAMGSHGRYEASAASDLDSAVAWTDDGGAEVVMPLVRYVLDGLAACGFQSDEHGVSADRRLFARPVSRWRAEISELLADPSREGALILISLLYDSRHVAGAPLPELFDPLEDARARRTLLRLMLRLALANRPPTGFLRDIVVESSGRHRGRLDLKRCALQPVVDLARYASLAAGLRLTSTVERLRGAAEAGTLDRRAAETLVDAFNLFSALRMEHQTEQLRQGQLPDDHLDPAALSPLTRRYLREAFRAVSATQRGLENELHATLS